MTPPSGNDKPTPQEPSIDTQRMFREMAERENPRKAAEKAAKFAIESCLPDPSELMEDMFQVYQQEGGLDK